MKKKVLVVMLAITMMFTAAGCSKRYEKGNVEGNAEQTAKTEEREEKETEKTAEEFSFGQTNGGTYTSEFLRIACTLPDGWTFFTQAQMQELNGAVYDMVGDDLKKQLETSKVIYDMYATNVNTAESVNIVLENMGIVYGTLLDEAKYVELSMNQLKTAMENAGVTNLVLEQNTVEFAGESRVGVLMTGTSEGIQIYQQQAVIREGTYMAVITATSYNENTLEQIIGNFSAL